MTSARRDPAATRFRLGAPLGRGGSAIVRAAIDRWNDDRPVVLKLLRADRADTACYVLVLSACLVRVLMPLLAPTLTLPAIQASAVLWSAGFALFALRYAPVLTRARLDGRPG